MSERTLARIEYELTEAETRLKLAVSRHAWRDAIHYATAAAGLEDEKKALAARPERTNIVGRKTVKG